MLQYTITKQDFKQMQMCTKILLTNNKEQDKPTSMAISFSV